MEEAMQTFLIVVLILMGATIFGLIIASTALGLVVIGEREVGVVVKKFTLGGHRLPPGQLVALNGEAGYQADTLAPGWHLGKSKWQWQISLQLQFDF
jgi:uncharacterized membrane protein YqiK